MCLGCWGLHWGYHSPQPPGPRAACLWDTEAAGSSVVDMMFFVQKGTRGPLLAPAQLSSDRPVVIHGEDTAAEQVYAFTFHFRTYKVFRAPK